MTNVCTIEFDGDGNTFYRLKGKLHREDGPAVELANGDRRWYLNGQLHREDGPAIELANGDKYWRQNGLLHREDGPAVEFPEGTKYWYLNGKLHREDGPAIECADGAKYWYQNGEQVTEEEVMDTPSQAKAIEGDVASLQKELKAADKKIEQLNVVLEEHVRCLNRIRDIRLLQWS